MRPYVIQQGDYVSKIAARVDSTASAIWDLEKNAELRRKRNPNLLFPGDILWVPVVEPQWLPITTGTTNRIVASVSTTSIRVKFQDRSRVFAGESCFVSMGAAEREASTDGAGILALEVPVFVDTVRVCFDSLKRRYVIRIGHMDPIDTLSGVTKRLHNLGYTEFGADYGQGDESLAQAMAIAAFQAESGLPETGVIDAATTNALLEAHGA